MDKVYNFIMIFFFKQRSWKLLSYKLKKTPQEFVLCYLNTTEQANGDLDPRVGVVSDVAVRTAADLLDEVAVRREEEDGGADSVRDNVVIILVKF